MGLAALRLLSACGVGLVLLPPAFAQDAVKPYFMVIVDNSGSMGGSTGGGNNSCGQPETRMAVLDLKCFTPYA